MLRVRQTKELRDGKATGYFWEAAEGMYPINYTFVSNTKCIGYAQTVTDQVPRKPAHILQKVKRKYSPKVRIKKALELNDFSARKCNGSCSVIPEKLVITDVRDGYPTHFEMSGQIAAVNTDCLYVDGYNLGDIDTPMLVWDPVRADRALAKAYAKFAVSEDDLSVGIAEIEKTLSTAVDLVMRLSKGANSVLSWFWSSAIMARERGLTGVLSYFSSRSGRKVSVKRVSKSTLDKAANRWLEFRFAIVPTMVDWDTFIGTFQTVIDNFQRIRCARANISETASVVVKEATATYGLFQLKYRYKVVTRRKTTAGVYYKYQYNPTLQDRWGFRLNRLPAMFWERVPFSFVVDWFFGINLLLDAISPDPSRIYLGNFVTQKLEHEVTQFVVEVLYINRYPNKVIGSPDQRFRFNRREVIRKVNQVLPDFPVEVSRWINTIHIADTLSLLWQTKLKHLL